MNHLILDNSNTPVITRPIGDSDGNYNSIM